MQTTEALDLYYLKMFELTLVLLPSMLPLALSSAFRKIPHLNGMNQQQIDASIKNINQFNKINSSLTENSRRRKDMSDP